MLYNIPTEYKDKLKKKWLVSSDEDLDHLIRNNVNLQAYIEENFGLSKATPVAPKKTKPAPAPVVPPAEDNDNDE